MPEQNPNEPIFKVPPADLVDNPHKTFFARHILAEILALVVVIAVGAGGYYWQTTKSEPVILPVHQDKTNECRDTPTGGTALCGGQMSKINSFDTCIAAGYPMMKSLPAKCQGPDGSVFVDYETCIQVIQRAKNPKTGQERDFPTPCDVPEGWEKV